MTRKKIIIIVFLTLLIVTYGKSISSIPSYSWKQTAGGSVGDFLFKDTYRIQRLIIIKNEQKLGVAVFHICDRLVVYSFVDRELGFYMAI